MQRKGGFMNQIIKEYGESLLTLLLGLGIIGILAVILESVCV